MKRFSGCTPLLTVIHWSQTVPKVPIAGKRWQIRVCVDDDWLNRLRYESWMISHQFVRIGTFKKPTSLSNTLMVINIMILRNEKSSLLNTYLSIIQSSKTCPSMKKKALKVQQSKRKRSIDEKIFCRF